jgi:hypothetical protein
LHFYTTWKLIEKFSLRNCFIQKNVFL